MINLQPRYYRALNSRFGRNEAARIAPNKTWVFCGHSQIFRKGSMPGGARTPIYITTKHSSHLQCNTAVQTAILSMWHCSATTTTCTPMRSLIRLCFAANDDC
jgi:hypothetical protein